MDLYAERYAAAVTLYELATGPGCLPKWGDGVSDPTLLTCEATIDGDLFDASLRERLLKFFTQAFRRDPKNDSTMPRKCCVIGANALAIWMVTLVLSRGRCQPTPKPPGKCHIETHVAELGLGTRATNALDRANILTVSDLLSVPANRLVQLRGVGNKTRREIASAVQTPARSWDAHCEPVPAVKNRRNRFARSTPIVSASTS